MGSNPSSGKVLWSSLMTFSAWNIRRSIPQNWHNIRIKFHSLSQSQHSQNQYT
jgi:hypothetical protein